MTLRLVQDRDRIAGGMNDVVVHRLFSAGLALETVLGLMGDQPGAAKVEEAIGQLDLAIRDFRNVLFDRHQPAGGRHASRKVSVRPRDAAHKRPISMLRGNTVI